MTRRRAYDDALRLPPITAEQREIGTDVGRRRYDAAVAVNARPQYGQSPIVSRADHELGALGELTVADWLGLRALWLAGLVFVRPDARRGDAGTGDIGTGLQIRTMRYTGPNPWLVIHPPDPSSHVFAGVRIAGAIATVYGWIRAGAGKQHRWWTEPRPGRPCFTVPWTELAQPGNDPARAAARLELAVYRSRNLCPHPLDT